MINLTNKSALMIKDNRDKRWLILVCGFTFATMQIIGLLLTNPTKTNLFNVAVMLFFLGISLSIRPLGKK